MDPELKTLILEQGNALSAFAEKYAAEMAMERKEREDLELRLSRGGIRGERKSDAQPERKAVGLFVKNGDETELKAMQVGSEPDGGYTVLPSMADAIRTKVRNLSPIANLARRVSVDRADSWEEPYDLTDIDAAWVGENAARTALSTATIGLLHVPLQEIYTSQVVTQKLLDTSMFDIGAWIEGRIANKFARTEGSAFINGDGIAKPKGLLSYATSTSGDSTRADGVLQYVPSGAAGAFASTNPVDCIVDLVHALRAPYRANAAFLMNSKTAGLARTLKDSYGRFLWYDSLAEGMPNMLMGYPVYMDEEFPDIAANSYSIAFGDFAQAYVIAEQPGIKLLRDPFTTKPNLLIYAYHRIGGAVAEGEAVKLLKFSAS